VRTAEDQQGEPNGEPTALRVISPRARRCPLHDDVDADEPTAGQRRDDGQNSEELRDVGTRRAGALCRPGRTEEEEKVWSGGVSDPGLALDLIRFSGRLT
jgi:hypothetical protein